MGLSVLIKETWYYIRQLRDGLPQSCMHNQGIEVAGSHFLPAPIAPIVSTNARRPLPGPRRGQGNC
jgi:hypothetical protein